jgi:hypothetical protein
VAWRKAPPHPPPTLAMPRLAASHVIAQKSREPCVPIEVDYLLGRFGNCFTASNANQSDPDSKPACISDSAEGVAKDCRRTRSCRSTLKLRAYPVFRSHVNAEVRCESPIRRKPFLCWVSVELGSSGSAICLIKLGRSHPTGTFDSSRPHRSQHTLWPPEPKGIRLERQLSLPKWGRCCLSFLSYPSRVPPLKTCVDRIYHRSSALDALGRSLKTSRTLAHGS